MSEAVSWIGYGLVVAALFGGGALVLEQGMRQLRRPTRWVWAVALLGTVLLPLLVELRPAPAPDTVLVLPVMTLPALQAAGTAESGFQATSFLVLAWLLLSAGVLLRLALSHVALRRAARAWRATSCDGVEVWVSESVGPAVVGVRRSRVVVPEWVLRLPDGERALLLLHEREHQRSGDARLVAAAYVAAVIMPWNPLVWWQLARLRHAVELDCDARVLARGGTVRPYGALLLEVGRRKSRQPLLAAAFAERPTRLEQRIRALVDHSRARRPLRGALLALFGIALLGTAYCVRDPLAGNDMPLAAAVSESAAPVDAKPTFTPYTEPPALQNVTEVQRALVEQYPPLLREAGIGGRVLVWAFIAENGLVTKTQLSKSSGYPALDEAALNVLTLMRFSPALNRDAPAPVWIELPIVFSASGADATKGSAGTERPTVVPVDTPPPMQTLPRRPAPPGALPPQVDTAGLPRKVGEQPSFTPMTQRPELANFEVVKRALVESYPPLLRDAGIGGMVTVWFLIDETGTVRRTQLSRTSGRGELDEAALKVARVMRFSPAENRGTKVPVWVEIPIVYAAK